MATASAIKISRKEIPIRMAVTADQLKHKADSDTLIITKHNDGTFNYYCTALSYEFFIQCFLESEMKRPLNPDSIQAYLHEQINSEAYKYKCAKQKFPKIIDREPTSRQPVVSMEVVRDQPALSASMLPKEPSVSKPVFILPKEPSTSQLCYAILPPTEVASFTTVASSSRSKKRSKVKQDNSVKDPSVVSKNAFVQDHQVLTKPPGSVLILPKETPAGIKVYPIPTLAPKDKSQIPPSASTHQQQQQRVVSTANLNLSGPFYSDGKLVKGRPERKIFSAAGLRNNTGRKSATADQSLATAQLQQQTDSSADGVIMQISKRKYRKSDKQPKRSPRSGANLVKAGRATRGSGVRAEKMLELDSFADELSTEIKVETSGDEMDCDGKG